MFRKIGADRAFIGKLLEPIALVELELCSLVEHKLLFFEFDAFAFWGHTCSATRLLDVAQFGVIAL